MAQKTNGNKNKQAVTKIKGLLADFLKQHEALRAKAEKIYTELSKEEDSKDIAMIKNKIKQL